MRVISSRQKNPCKYVSDLNRKNKLIDNKLSSVSINIPPSKCNIPPIYLNLDKDKTIKLHCLSGVGGNILTLFIYGDLY